MIRHWSWQMVLSKYLVCAFLQKSENCTMVMCVLDEGTRVVNDAQRKLRGSQQFRIYQMDKRSRSAVSGSGQVYKVHWRSQKMCETLPGGHGELVEHLAWIWTSHCLAEESALMDSLQNHRLGPEWAASRATDWPALDSALWSASTTIIKWGLMQ